MDNIKDYENTVTERIYDLMANINPCESCKFRGGTTDKCGNCCFWYPSEFVMGDESEPEKPTSDKDLTNALEIIKEILSRPDGQISYETRAKAEQFLSEVV